MAFNLKNGGVLTLRDFTATEIRSLLMLSADLKAAKHAETEQRLLRGKQIGLILERDSTAWRR